MYLGLVDVGAGNIGSLKSALKKIGIKYQICKEAEDFENINKIILPGVGNFNDFMNKIKSKNLDKLIEEKYKKNIPILGICLGFQVLFSNSSESGFTEGFNFIDGKIINFKEKLKTLRTPHVGWNNCTLEKKSTLFENVENNSDFYFTHSFFLNDCNKDYIISKTDYGFQFISGVEKNNLYGVQFHPEKSQLSGIKVLKNFYERC
tara:strand:- start:21 stop:635 length:615 start_codon:yes stop_codon:yes gene_type:complete